MTQAPEIVSRIFQYELGRFEIWKNYHCTSKSWKRLMCNIFYHFSITKCYARRTTFSSYLLTLRIIFSLLFFCFGLTTIKFCMCTVFQFRLLSNRPKGGITLWTWIPFSSHATKAVATDFLQFVLPCGLILLCDLTLFCLFVCPVLDAIELSNKFRSWRRWHFKRVSVTCPRATTTFQQIVRRHALEKKLVISPFLQICVL